MPDITLRRATRQTFGMSGKIFGAHYILLTPEEAAGALEASDNTEIAA